jgi:hypothetical protein
MWKSFVLGLAMLGAAGCCCMGGSADEVHDAPGPHGERGYYVECRAQGENHHDCERRIRDICHGEYDIVTTEHVHEWGHESDERSIVATCRG